jgi:NAD(P)-dependent dehydrogenase (short-subunit alcohol dehydrogenase family)
MDGGVAVVIGAGGGIGRALCQHWLESGRFACVTGISRSDPRLCGLQWRECDYSEAAIAASGRWLAAQGRSITRVAICTGLLHDTRVKPEKRVEELCGDAMLAVLRANTVVPALWLQALLPAVAQGDGECVVAALSARVGSIGDNRLGGWYSYRASKAALNMVLQSAAIEFARRARRVKLLAFHPGTTDTALSKPFQANVPAEKLFAPQFVAQRLTAVMDGATADGRLDFIDWDGQPIVW